MTTPTKSPTALRRPGQGLLCSHIAVTLLTAAGIRAVVQTAGYPSEQADRVAAEIRNTPRACSPTRKLLTTSRKCSRYSWHNTHARIMAAVHQQLCPGPYWRPGFNLVNGCATAQQDPG